MKRIKKEDLPEILIPDDNRKTVDIGKLLKDYANLLEKQFKENWYKERHKELAEHLLLRKGFARWIEKQRERAESNSDLRRIELFLKYLEENPKYRVETIIKYTQISSLADRMLVFDFSKITAEELNKNISSLKFKGVL